MQEKCHNAVRAVVDCCSRIDENYFGKSIRKQIVSGSSGERSTNLLIFLAIYAFVDDDYRLTESGPSSGTRP